MAEDNEINSMIAEELLKQAGAEVKTVENGQLAVDYFLNPDAEPVDLILMDINMPLINGFETTKKIREKGIQIKITVSNSSDKNETLNKALHTVSTNGATLQKTKFAKYAMHLKLIYISLVEGPRPT